MKRYLEMSVAGSCPIVATAGILECIRLLRRVKQLFAAWVPN